MTLPVENRNQRSKAARCALVVSFDRLHAGFLGCCGNDWIETPNLDRLASEGVAFDQHFCENLDPEASNHAWWTGKFQFPLDEDRQRQCPAFVDELHARGVSTYLVVESDGRDDAAVAPPFGDVLSVRGSDGFEVPEAETPFARAVLHCGEWLRESTGREEPALLWIKSRGVPVPWVPPQAFAELYLDEFGLAAESADEPGDETDAGASSATAAAHEPSDAVPDGSLDWRYAAAMYAAYVTLLDRWLGKLLTTLKETPGWDDALIIVTAGMGQSLGEHDPLGDEKLPLRSEWMQTPLWVRVPGSDQASTRRQSLVLSVDLAPTLLEWFGGSGSKLDPSERGASPLEGRSLFPEIRNEPVPPRELVVMGNGRSEWGVRTADFFYVEAGDQNPEPARQRAMLFEKPHDRWDQSDVLSQYPQIGEELRAALDSEIGRLRAGGTP